MLRQSQLRRRFGGCGAAREAELGVRVGLYPLQGLIHGGDRESGSHRGCDRRSHCGEGAVLGTAKTLFKRGRIARRGEEVRV